MVTSAENAWLTETGAGTPMGDLMRYYWIPACLAERVREPGGAPVELRLFGEDLVVFRDTAGQVGLLGRYCPHRGASLVLARNEDCGLRCIYHGWKVDSRGSVVETPPEPANSRFAQTIKHKAYPTWEAGGIVWAYMGPDDPAPEPPALPWFDLPEENYWAVHFLQPCNYLQGLEGDLDYSHGAYLHYSEEEALRQRNGLPASQVVLDKQPRGDAQERDWGLQGLFQWRIPGEKDVRLSWYRPFVFPMFTMLPGARGRTTSGAPGDTAGLFHAYVPVDDHTHYVYTVNWDTQRPLDEDYRAGLDKTQRYSDYDPDRGYLSRSFDGTGYRQNRESMAAGVFSGFDGIHTQDLAVQYSMGPNRDRSLDHLSGEDYIIRLLREHLLKRVRGFVDDGARPSRADVEGSTRNFENRWVRTAGPVSLDELVKRPELNGDVIDLTSAADEPATPTPTATKGA
jgi:phenylpropionate dioxygenase-like ring-hydroxylating dioxygenase large terminal subunit